VTPAPTPTVVVVAAHPDDETIGSGALIADLWDVYVVHVTDGAPRDARFVPHRAPPSSEAYRAARRREVTRALSLAGMRPDRIFELGAVDQEATLDLAELSWSLRSMLQKLRPAVLIAHGYEGGHPDHDATSFIARASVRLLQASGARTPLLAEMLSYHGAGEGPSSVSWQGGSAAPAVCRSCHGAAELVRALRNEPEQSQQFCLSLGDADRSLKARMLACFQTQRDLLDRFAIEDERFRLAPDYDFSRPPHEGTLHYERLNWPMTGERWRSLARAAEVELGLAS
jgi:LmbE family N-acetylglucosaminyl deacetylase